MGIENEYEGKIVLVTGGAGCIGTNLSNKLAELGARVIILDDLSSAYEWNIPKAKNIVFVKGSVLDDEMLKRVFKFKPDYVFHLAAHFANYFHNLYGLPIVNARFFNVFGPGEVPGRYRNVIPNFFYWAMNKQALPITGDGAETRDWTYVDDIVDGLLAMGIKEAAVGEAINLGSGKEHRVIDLANTVNTLTGQTLRKFNQKRFAEAGIKYIERRDWDVKHRLLSSIEKAKKLLGYEPQIGFEDGLKNVQAWFVENRENIKRSAEF